MLGWGVISYLPPVTDDDDTDEDEDDDDHDDDDYDAAAAVDDGLSAVEPLL